MIVGAELATLTAAGQADLAEQALSIPGGTFRMGDNDLGFADEKPAHDVTVSSFKMMKDAVTNTQYQTWVKLLGDRRYFLVGTDLKTGWPKVLAMGTKEAAEEYKGRITVVQVAEVMGADLSTLTHGAYSAFFSGAFQVWEAAPCNPYASFDRPRQPANVDWHSAYLYAFMHRGRLATEAEHEFASTKGGTQRYATASGEVREDEIHAQIGEKRPFVTIDVDDSSIPDGPYGLRHLAGNIWEWVMDWYGKDYYSQPPAKDPSGPVSGVSKVLRGGSWFNGAGVVRAAYRAFTLPDGRDFVGFRVAWPEHSKT